MKKINIGILAHVDAGKTTLSESFLYEAGKLRQIGRVDHKNAFLDYNEQERNRGITIFSKQAMFTWEDCEFTLLDTPGHVDFSSEMERTLQVLDYAILLIQANDGVQAHTQTIWDLLQFYQVPTFLFINKMDAAYQTQDELQLEIQKKLGQHCINFCVSKDIFFESVAMCEDRLLEEYMETTTLQEAHIADAIANRTIVPCYYGSALKLEGISTLLHGLQTFTAQKQYQDEFAAIIYKVSHDQRGDRLVHIKITGGSLAVKTRFTEEDKVDQIRQYHGEKFELLQVASAGTVCTIKGCKTLQAGMVLGAQQPSKQAQVSSFMEYRVSSKDCDQYTLLQYLHIMSEEDPQLHIHYHAQLEELRIQFMGEIQIEIFKQQIFQRFHVSADVDHGSVIYKETIAHSVEGIGHFEPLRHYAEVHVLLEPAPQNSGLHFFSDCPLDELSLQWQRLVLTHLQEKDHIGVLTGSPITDMNITLLTGKAHEKHTEGGDFRQATYRALRQGLKRAENVLLEPYYSFTLEIPTSLVSKAIFDIEQMHGSFQLQESDDETTTLTGEASAIALQDYQTSVLAYSSGKGRLQCRFHGYKPCIEQNKVVKQIAYDSENDIENPTGSIFCAHGAGFFVPWNQVSDYMHLHSSWERQHQDKPSQAIAKIENDEDLEKIYIRTYGPIRQRSFRETPKEVFQTDVEVKKGNPECLLVDGYNVIYTWAAMKEEKIDDLEGAKNRLVHELCSYQSFKKNLLIVVFDAYKVEHQVKEVTQKDHIYIVYTKHAQTADMYIESVTHKLAADYRVIVATSDGMEQLITMGQGASIMSSRQLINDMQRLKKLGMDEIVNNQKKYRTYLLEDIRDYEEE